MAGVLEGLRVVEGSAFVAAPLGGMTLAQMGADVIRFDPIGGGLDYRRWPITKSGQSLFWSGMNKGKRSIQIDISKAEGREIVAEIITRPGADGGIFLTNFPERGWLAYDVLKKRREDLIYVNILGDRKGGSAVDYTVNCAVGFANATGSVSSSEPTNYLLPAWDNITGQMAAVALLAAERFRRQHGKGQLVRLALKDVALATAGHLGNIAEVMVNHHERERVGNYLYGSFGRDFVTADDRRLMIVALTLRQWHGLIRAMNLEAGIARLANELQCNFELESDRFKERVRIAALMEPWFASRRIDEVGSLFEENGVCWGPYRTFAEMVSQDDDCTLDNPLFQMAEQPGIGKYLMPRSPLNFGLVQTPDVRPAPQLGQHTQEILSSELGMSAGEIGRLYDKNIIAGPELAANS